MPPEALGLLYDSTLCIGCKACMAACKEANGMPPEFSTVEQYWDTPLDISGKTLNIIKMYKNGTACNKDSEKNGYAFMKVSCLHCVDPSCVSACPVSAMTKDPVTGIVGYNKDACIGCRYCVVACPFGVPRFQYDTAFPQIAKCELCTPPHARTASTRPAPRSARPAPPCSARSATCMAEAKRRLALKPGEDTEYPARQDRRRTDQATSRPRSAKYVQQIYGEKECGGTQVLKLSAVPFEKLGMPDAAGALRVPASRRPCSTRSTAGWCCRSSFLGGLTFIAKRNVKPDDEATTRDGKE